MSTQHLQQRIAELEQRRREAAQAEAARLATVEQHQRDLQTAESELEQLRQAEADSLFADAVSRDQQLIAQNDAAINTLQNQLTEVASRLHAEFIGIGKPVTTSFEQQQTNARAALGAIYKQVFDQAAGVKGHPMVDPAHARLQAAQAEMPRYTGQLDTALPLAEALAEWVAAESDPDQKRLRQGIAYIFTGQIYDPKPISRQRRREIVRAVTRR